MATTYTGNASIRKLNSLTGSAGSESSNVIRVSAAFTDVNGNAVSSAIAFHAELFDANGLRCVVGSFRLSVGTKGSLTTASAKPSVFGTTNASGEVELDVTDVATGSAATVHLLITPVGVVGSPVRVPVTFDNA